MVGFRNSDRFYPGPGDSIRFIEDPRIRILVLKHMMMNAEKKGVPGFRVQIFSDSGTQAKKNASQTKTDFLTKYPDTPAYLTYIEPNFKIRVGDFRTRNAALKFQQQILQDFPNSFIVRDDVSFENLR